MRYLPMNKKGVSPIIATLLLIVIAVAAAVVTYAFVTGFIGTSSGSASQQGTMSYDAYTITGDTTVDIFIRNSGTKALTINTAYIDGAQATPAANAPGDLALMPGDVEKVTVTQAGATLQNGVAHQLRLVCTDGTPLQISIVKS